MTWGLGEESAERPGCCHRIEASVTVTMLDESGGPLVMLDLTARCVICGSPAKFLGQRGCSFDRPMASANGLELHCPANVEGL